MAKIIAEHQNLEGLPIAVMTHPVGDKEVSKIQKKADNIIYDVIKILTTDSNELEHELKETKYETTEGVCLYADKMAKIIKEEEFYLSDSIEEINDVFYGEGWTDGLPIIPPGTIPLRSNTRSGSLKTTAGTSFLRSWIGAT